VDYEARRQALARLRLAHRHDPQELCRRLLDELTGGEAKLYLIWRLLALRRCLAPVFVEGGYQPLQANGPGAKHVVAYARTAQGRHIVVVTPRLPYRLTDGQSLPLGPAWSKTRIDLSPLGRLGAGVEWLSNLELNLSRQRHVAIGRLLACFPIAVWVEGSLDPMTTKRGPAAAG
jgi:(1->4)-alpha-D-glucan 1-alpha-D-glucosylmutase